MSDWYQSVFIWSQLWIELEIGRWRFFHEILVLCITFFLFSFFFFFLVINPCYKSNPVIIGPILGQSLSDKKKVEKFWRLLLHISLHVLSLSYFGMFILLNCRIIFILTESIPFFLQRNKRNIKCHWIIYSSYELRKIRTKEKGSISEDVNERLILKSDLLVRWTIFAFDRPTLLFTNKHTARHKYAGNVIARWWLLMRLVENVFQFS